MRKNDAERLARKHESSLARMAMLYKELTKRAGANITERVLQQRVACSNAMRRIEDTIEALGNDQYYRKISKESPNNNNKTIANRSGEHCPPRTTKRSPAKRRR